MTQLQLVTIIISVLTALTRIIPTTKPLWDKLGSYKIVPPIGCVIAGYFLRALVGGDWVTGVEIDSAMIVALLAPGVAEHSGKLLTIVLLVLGLSAAPGCSRAQGPEIKTALEIARLACQQWAGEMGEEAETVCATEEQLAPFIDALLTAKRHANAKRFGEEQ